VRVRSPVHKLDASPKIVAMLNIPLVDDARDQLMLFGYI